ncbi:hypothetical protein HanXRQr2_Chr10g0452511 [Helianthus annuus]|uniref:Knottin, scorpion toxin-like protein n=1 Tax=Helianthus annuus TaxID=4232 RepID=A0A251TMQ8_HELAN|nr:hypothetical protein HanXRQr2_Chr10g0452511 [Helianthus annuus]
MTRSSLIFNMFLLSLMITGMELVIAQHFCTDTHFLFPCEKYGCSHLCVILYGYRSFGECKNPLRCRCYFHCPEHKHYDSSSLPPPLQS